MKELAGYTGIPYLAGGRDRAGCDCYGLMRLVLLESFHVELPEMITGPVSPRRLSHALTNGTRELAAMGRLRHVTPDAAPADTPLIAVSWHNRIATHCGLVLGLRFLHTSEQTGESVLERIHHYRARSGPLECYQWHK